MSKGTAHQLLYAVSVRDGYFDRQLLWNLQQISPPGANVNSVPVVNVFSSLPAGLPTDTQPNWVTCPWPDHFTEILD